jgi:putative transposase
VTKFAFVATARANHAIATLCRVVGVSVSGFYAWLRAIPSRQSRAEAEAALRGHISRIFAAKHRVYGAPGSMLSCAGRGTGTRDAGSSG